MTNMQAPWDPLWRYILDEHSDDESTLESYQPKRQPKGSRRRRRFHIPRRDRQLQSSRSVDEAEATTFLPDERDRSTGGKSNHQNREHDRKWSRIEGTKSTNVDARSDAPSMDRRQVTPSARQQKDKNNNGVLELMKRSMFNEEKFDKHDTDARCANGYVPLDTPSVATSEASEGELGVWAYGDQVECVRDSRDDVSSRSDQSEDSACSVESEFSKFVGTRASSYMPKSSTPTTPLGRCTNSTQVMPTSPKCQQGSPSKPIAAMAQDADPGDASCPHLNNEHNFESGAVEHDNDTGHSQLQESVIDSNDKIEEGRGDMKCSNPEDFDKFIEMEMERLAAERRKRLGTVFCRSVKDRGEEDSRKLRGGPGTAPRVASRSASLSDTNKTAVVSRRCFGERAGAKPNADFPVVRLVADEEGPQQVVTAERSLLAPAHLASRKGPQSVFEYDYASENHMDVVYDQFGVNPRSLIHVRSFKAPKSIHLESDEVLLKVEASTVSPTDCSIRRGRWWRGDKILLPCTPGADLLGNVCQLHPNMASKFKLKKGERVLSLVKWGGNARYAKVSPEKLVKVPRDVDAAKAVCLVQSFLSAFQALHLGQRNSQRYRKNALLGKSILVVGAMSNVGRAVLELAREAGVSVYAIGKDKQHQRLKSLGGLPLGKQVESWFPHVAGRMDLVIDASGDNVTQSASQNYLKALNEHGQLVFIGQPVNVDAMGAQLTGSSKSFCISKSNSHARDRIQYLDVFESWSTNLERSKKDLEHLLNLLRSQTIEPVVIDRIPLTKIGRAHETLEGKRLHGFLVCEPWIKSKQRAVYL